MASFASSATTGGTRKHASTNYQNIITSPKQKILTFFLNTKGHQSERPLKMQLYNRLIYKNTFLWGKLHACLHTKTTRFWAPTRLEQERFWPIKQESRLSFWNLNLNQDSRICRVKYQCQSRFEVSEIKILISIKIQEIFGGNNVIKQDPRTRGKSQDQARFKTFWYKKDNLKKFIHH